MNKHIELVKKWLADPASVKQQELDDNRDAAQCAYYAAVFEAASAAAAYYAYYASVFAANDDTAMAELWVRRYEELKELENER
jgi:hypothetical protein